MTPDTFPDWAPEALVGYITKTVLSRTEPELELCLRLAQDPRMQAVWAWHAKTFKVQHTNKADPDYDHDVMKFVSLIEQAYAVPEKPGSLPAKEREEYLDEVLEHAQALLRLLEETRYDLAGTHTKEVGTTSGLDIAKYAGSKIAALQKDAEAHECEYLIAFRATAQGLVELPYSYPDCHLREILRELVEWTRQTDYWGRERISSASLLQSPETGRVAYFSRTLFKTFEKTAGIRIPYPSLATLANVSLKLLSEQEIDENTVKQQIRRGAA